MSKSLTMYSGLIAVYTILGMILLWPTQTSLVKEGRDIRQDYLGGRRFMQKFDLYTPFSQAELISIHVEPDLGMDRNFHPPTTLVFFIPLTLLNFQWAVLVWGVISLLLFFTSMYLILNDLGYRKWFFYTPCLLLWFPLWLHMRFGQFSILILFFLVLVWINLRRNKTNFAGLFLALACLVKIFPLVIVILLVIKRQWKTLVWFSFSVTLSISVIYLYYHHSMSKFVIEIAPQNSTIFRNYFGNFSLNGFVGRLFNGTSHISPLFSENNLESFIYYSGLGLFILIAITFSRNVKDFDLCFATFIVVMLIVSPTTWAHSFVILLLPACILLASMRKSNNRLGSLLFIVVALLSSIPHWHYYTWLMTIAPTRLLPSWLLFTSPGFYVLVGLLTLCIWQGFRSRQPRQFSVQYVPSLDKK